MSCFMKLLGKSEVPPLVKLQKITEMQKPNSNMTKAMSKGVKACHPEIQTPP